MKNDSVVRSNFDIEEGFVEPMLIIIEDLRNFIDDGLSEDFETDAELARRIMMLKDYTVRLKEAMATQ